MKAFEIRLATQHRNNVRHVKNLQAFCEDKSRFTRLDPEDQALILSQLELMTKLDSILEERMRRLKLPV